MERDLPSLAGLRSIQLTLWAPEDEEDEEDGAYGDFTGNLIIMMSQFASLLPRLPSLRSFIIYCGQCVDDVALRILVSLESDLLPELTYLRLDGGCSGRQRGVMFLLILWLKRQAMTALESKESVPGAKLDVDGLYFNPDSCISTLIQQCWTQVKEAQESI